jgi:predicted permease
MNTLRLVLRSLRRAPLFTLAAAGSLALGIGSNTAILSLADSLLLRRLPVADPDALVYLYSAGPWQGFVSTDEPGGPSFSFPLLRELQAGPSPFLGIAGSRSTLVNVNFDGRPSYDIARLVSGSYFEVLGLRPALGRLLTPDDDQTPGAHFVAILSHAYWTSRFGASPAVLNRTIQINVLRFRVIGVAPPGFSGERVGEPADLFLPLSMMEAITPGRDWFNDRTAAWVTLLARTKPGIPLDRAEAEINLAYREQVERDEQLLRQPGADFLQRFRQRKMTLKPGAHGRGSLPRLARRPLMLLMSVGALVLLIACANVAGLQLARGAARARETAVRLAVGASRGRIARELLLESGVVALAGGLAGLALAFGILRAVSATLPAPAAMRFILSGGLGGRALLISLGLTLLSMAVFGLAPALGASRPDLVKTLKEQAGQILGGAGQRARKALVTVQVAIATVLLIAGGLFARTLVNLLRFDLGVRTDHLVAFDVLPKFSGYTDERVAQFHEQLIGRLRAIPGVRLVSSAQLAALGGLRAPSTVVVEGHGEPARAYTNRVGSDYFRTLGTPLLEGREFTSADTRNAPKVAIVSEAFARRFFPDHSPIGRRIGHMPLSGAATPDMEIVGLARDAAFYDARESPVPLYYTPIRQTEAWYQVYFYLRTDVPPETILPLIPREVAALDPDLGVRDLKTVDRQVRENLFRENTLATLTIALASLATLLAAMGLYGSLAYAVARRTREIGIRMALGAAPGKVRRLVLHDAALTLGIGIAVGVGASAAAGRLMQAALFGVRAWDPATCAGAVILLSLAALAGAGVPAHRATRVDPLVALRHE